MLVEWPERADEEWSAEIAGWVSGLQANHVRGVADDEVEALVLDRIEETSGSYVDGDVVELRVEATEVDRTSVHVRSHDPVGVRRAEERQ